MNTDHLEIEKHIDDLVRHINLVREAGLLLGKRLIRRGEVHLGRLLIAKVFVHDASKFYGIEWNYLHNGNDIPKEKIEEAVTQHQSTNEHHPEHWGGIKNMHSDVAIAEMCCDWYARSQEFGTGLRDWIAERACAKFKIEDDSEQQKLINKFVDILLESSFVDMEPLEDEKNKRRRRSSK